MNSLTKVEMKENRFVPLEPFIHQVGGHTSMMKFDEVTICKPLIPRECRFYKELPSDLRPFAPEFRGVVLVRFLENEDDGHIHLIAYPNKTHEDEHSSSSSDVFMETEQTPFDDSILSSSPQRKSRRHNPVECLVDKGQHRVRLRSGRIEFISTRVDRTFEAKDVEGNEVGSESTANPWSLHVHEKQLHKMIHSSKSKLHKFILLENVTSSFTHPCILDLKMGTRQHGVDVPLEKRERHMAKCAATTSRTLGLRLCGMQVYLSSLGRFVCRNKYYGRKLSDAGFYQAIKDFFYNGTRVRDELIQPFIRKLQKLKKVIEKQHSFRFYSSSLLLIYDGEQSHGFQGNLGDSAGSDELNTSWSGKGKPRVGVRMIDFAHSTHHGFRDHEEHHGPDTGYILGLDSLTRLLQDIEKEVHYSGTCTSSSLEENMDVDT